MYTSLTTSHNISTKGLITIGALAFSGKLERLKMQQIAFKLHMIQSELRNKIFLSTQVLHKAEVPSRYNKQMTF